MLSQLKIGNKIIKLNHPDDSNVSIQDGTLVVNPSIVARSEEHRFKEALSAEGIQWGDAIKWATDKAGIKQCPSCRQAQLVLNQVRKLGWVEALRQVVEIKRGK